MIARTPVRSGEFGRIKIEHVDPANGVITGWGAKDEFNPREILITDKLMPVVERLCEATKDYLVPGGMNYVSLLCARWRKRLNLPALNARDPLTQPAHRLRWRTVSPWLTLRSWPADNRVSTTDRYVQSIASETRIRKGIKIAERGLDP